MSNGISGSLNVTEKSDIIIAFESNISGILATNEKSDTVIAVGNNVIFGSLSTHEKSDTIVSSGVTFRVITIEISDMPAIQSQISDFGTYAFKMLAA